MQNHRIQTPIFVGIHLNKKLHYQLNQSSAWKESLIAWQSTHDGLQNIHYKSKDYIGKRMDQEQPTLQDLYQIQSNIVQVIKSLCPQIDSDHLEIYIFPLLLIS